MKNKIELIILIIILLIVLKGQSYNLYIDSGNSQNIQNGTIDYPFISISQALTFSQSFNSSILNVVAENEPYNISNYLITTQSLILQNNEFGIYPVINLSNCTFEINNLTFSGLVMHIVNLDINIRNLNFINVTINIYTSITISSKDSYSQSNLLFQYFIINLMYCSKCSLYMTNISNLTLERIQIYSDRKNFQMLNSLLNIQNVQNMTIIDLHLSTLLVQTSNLEVIH